MFDESAPIEPVVRKMSSRSLGQNALCFVLQNEVNRRLDKTYREVLRGEQDES